MSIALMERVKAVEAENAGLRTTVQDLRALVEKMEGRNDAATRELSDLAADLKRRIRKVEDSNEKLIARQQEFRKALRKEMRQRVGDPAPEDAPDPDLPRIPKPRALEGRT